MAYFDNMSRNHCNEAPLRGFLPSVHGFRLLSDAIRLGASVVDIRHVARSSIGSIALPFDWTAFAHSRRLLYCSRGPMPLWAPAPSNVGPYRTGRSGRIRFEAMQIKPLSK